MPLSNVWLRVDGSRSGDVLERAAETLETAGTEALLDFSSVERIDSRALKAMKVLADTGDSKGIKIALHGVKVDVYKALKLMKIAQRFSFLN